MESSRLKKVKKRLSEQNKHRHWKQLVSVFAILAMACVIFAIARPASTLEKEAYCGIEEHTHTDECYEEVLICGYEDTAASAAPADGAAQTGDVTQTDNAAQAGGTLQADASAKGEAAPAESHTHSDSCYTETKTLSCGQEESAGHAHTDNCYTVTEKRDLTCGTEESEEHTHTDECYTVTEEKTLTCGQEEGAGAHTHTDDCYTVTKELTCGKEETSGAGENAGGAAAEPGTPSVGDNTAEAGGSSEAGSDAHVHTDECYEKKLTCDKEEHEHTDECFEELLACGKREHTHTDACYDEAGNLICGKEEHTHIQRCRMPVFCGRNDHEHEYGCYIGSEVSEEDRERIINVDTMIDALPSYEEIAEQLNAYDEAEDLDGYENYYMEISFDAGLAYAYYEDLESLQQYVVNSEDLLMLSSLWEAATLDFSNDRTLKVCAINQYTSVGNTLALIYGNSGTVYSVAGATFPYWTAWIVEKKDEEFVVTQTIESADANPNKNGHTAEKGAIALSPNKFVIFSHGTADTSLNGLKVGSYVMVDFDYTKYKKGYNKNGYGTVTFGDVPFNEDAKAKVPKTYDIPTLNGANTSELVQIDLYDYGTNINNNYRKNKNYPAFQQGGGVQGDVLIDNVNSYNFDGNIITDLNMPERSITGKGGNINKIYNHANAPLNGLDIPREGTNVNPMKNTLGEDGYPHLADGNLSLGYLFGGDSTFSKKVNKQNLSGLFLYDAEHLSYSFDSRKQHAEYDEATDSIILYDALISGNYMVYPFGNFLPLNKIRTQTTKVEEIDREHFRTIAATAAEKKKTATADYLKEAYANLEKELTAFVKAMDAEYGRNWTIEDAKKRYFSNSTLPQDAWIMGDPNKMYSIDYDELKNYFFGMHIEMNIKQPKNGKAGKTGEDPVRFYFSGDDDVWVYVDDMLFLNLSGIHRHVAGTIDYEKGEVRYYQLSKNKDNVDLEVPDHTVKFATIITDALKDQGITGAQATEVLDRTLKKDGSGNYTTFKDNSSHNFQLYYMERGSGSSVCKMNFNFPLEEKNHLTIGKELSVDKGELSYLLGNPKFHFQVLEAGEDGKKRDTANEKLFVPKETTYKVYKKGSGTSENTRKELVCTQKHEHTDACYMSLVDTGETRKTDENGVFWLYSGEYAVFPDISVVTNGYYVRELLEKDYFSQYGDISVSGQAATIHHDIGVGNDSFEGVESEVYYLLDGSTFFQFDNKVKFDNLSKIEITKKIKLGADEEEFDDTKDTFLFEVRLGGIDGMPLAVGTPYILTKADGTTEDRTVETAGQISLKANETATIPYLLVGTEFTVKELNAATLGYKPEYDWKCSDITAADGGETDSETGTDSGETASETDGEETSPEAETDDEETSPEAEADGEETDSAAEADVGEAAFDSEAAADSEKYTYAELKTDSDNISYVAGKVKKIKQLFTVEVTNTLSPADVTIPVEKVLKNADEKQHSYRFVLQQVDAQQKPIEGGTKKELTITLPGAGTEQRSEAVFTIHYWNNAFSNGTTKVYYKIAEAKEEAEGSEKSLLTAYDEAEYLVEVTVTKEPGKLSAKPDQILRMENGKTEVKNKAIFENYLYGWRLVKRSSSKSDEGEHPTLKGVVFELKKAADDASAEETAYYGTSKDTDGIVTWYADRECTQEVKLFDLTGVYELREIEAPTGYLLSSEVWTVTLTPGELPQIRGESSELTHTSVKDADGTLAAEEFYFDDEISYQLPQAGGFGIYWYLIGGTLLMMAAALILYKNGHKEVRGR